LPQEKFGIKNVIVPIGPDEDNHFRICRDIAYRFGYNKPAAIHSNFIMGLDNNKMSKSRNNGINLNEEVSSLKKKINNAFSGGQPTIEEHRKLGGDPEVDISCQYLSLFFLNEEESMQLFEKYRKGEVLSGEVKKMLFDKTSAFLNDFQDKLKDISDKDVSRCLVKIPK
jgi:tryptophanyl-tRNA synthetase